MLAITDGSAAAVAAAKAALAPAAHAEFAKAEPKLKFFYVEDVDDDILAAVKRFAGLKNEALVLIDASNGKKFIAQSQDITEANVNAFVEGYANGSIRAQPVRQ